MINTLSIKRGYWPEVTDTPHFVVKLQYQGCQIEFDDIYFDKINEVVVQLETLYEERKGIVELHGGFRFNAVVEAKERGALQFRFSTESSGGFPGRLRLEGFFLIDGENSALFIRSLIDLFRGGKEFVI